MMTSERSIHIPYQFNNAADKHAIYEQKWKLTSVGLIQSVLPTGQGKILDYGTGRGELLNLLVQSGYKCVGIDADPVCVDLGSEYAPCYQANYDNLPFEKDEFDVVVALHVLEHVPNPSECVHFLKTYSSRYLLFAIPNLGTINRLQYRKKIDNVNRGHAASWDYPHFKNFIENICDLRVVTWGADLVVVPLFSNLLHSLKLRSAIEEQWLPKLFPYLTNSVIVLCEK